VLCSFAETKISLPHPAVQFRPVGEAAAANRKGKIG